MADRVNGGNMSLRDFESRMRRVMNTADRYERNILNRVQRTKAYKDSLRNLTDARKRGDMDAARKYYDENARVTQKAYSRATYMANSNG